jgi:hypothetical protein
MICNRFVVGLKVRFEFEFIGIAVIIVSNMKKKKKWIVFYFLLSYLIMVITTSSLSTFLTLNLMVEIVED